MREWNGYCVRWQNDKKFVAHKTEMGIHQTMEKNKATATDNESVVRCRMNSKLSEKCEFGNLCKDATRHDSLTVLGCSSFKTKKPMTEQEYLQSCNTEQLADVIADFYLLGYTHGHNQMDITSRTKWVEWLKQPHTKE